MTNALKLELLVKKSHENVRFQLLARQTETEKTVNYQFDNEVGSCLWSAEKPLVVEFSAQKGQHTLTIDIENSLPCGMLTLPEQTVAICDELPLLTDPLSEKPSRRATIWNPQTPPTNLESISESLFVRNPQLMDLTETFARLPHLKAIPKLVFLTLPKVRIFNGLFRESAIESVEGSFFSAAVNAVDFRSIFFGCRFLKTVPGNLFECNTKAWCFDSAFEKSGIEQIPPELFRHVLTGSSFIRAFAGCPIKEVPDGLLQGIKPIDVDGMFEPTAILDHDPLRIKAAPRFPPSFFTDIRMARGIPTLSEQK